MDKAAIIAFVRGYAFAQWGNLAEAWDVVWEAMTPDEIWEVVQEAEAKAEAAEREQGEAWKRDTGYDGYTKPTIDDVGRFAVIIMREHIAR